MWKEVGDAKKISLRTSIFFSTESEGTDWREKLEQSEGQSYDSSWKFLVCGRQDEKCRRLIIDIIPCVMVTSLETDAFVAFITYMDVLMVRSNLSGRSKKRKYSRSSWYLEGNKEESKVVYLKTQIQWILFHGKLENWDWTLRQDTPWNSWDASGTKQKFGKEKGNLEELSKKMNLMSEILARPVLRNNHLRKPHDKQVVPAKWRGIWRESMHNAEQGRLKLRWKGILRGEDSGTLWRYWPWLGKVQINEDARVSDSRSRSVQNSVITWWNASGSIASDALLKARISIWVEKRRNSTIGQQWKVNYLYNGQLRITCSTRTVIYSSSSSSSTSRSADQWNCSSNLRLSSDPVTTRSDKHACGKPMLTDPDKQATGNREPAHNNFFRRVVQGGSNARHSRLVAALHI